MANRTIWNDGDNITAAKLNNLENNAALGFDNSAEALTKLNVVTKTIGGVTSLNADALPLESVSPTNIKGIKKFATAGHGNEVIPGFVRANRDDSFSVQDKISKTDLDFNVADTADVAKKIVRLESISVTPVVSNLLVYGLKYYSCADKSGYADLCPSSVVQIMNATGDSIDIPAGGRVIGTIDCTYNPNLGDAIYIATSLFDPTMRIYSLIIQGKSASNTPNPNIVDVILKPHTEPGSIMNGSSMFIMVWGSSSEYNGVI